MVWLWVFFAITVAVLVADCLAIARIRSELSKLIETERVLTRKLVRLSAEQEQRINEINARLTK